MIPHKKSLDKTPAVKVSILVSVFFIPLITSPLVHASKEIKVWTQKKEIYQGDSNVIYIENIGSESVEIFSVRVTSPSGRTTFYDKIIHPLNPGEIQPCVFPRDFWGASTEGVGKYEVNVWWECGNEQTAFRVVEKTKRKGGGIIIPVDKFGLLAPCIALTSAIVFATVITAVCIKRFKRLEKK